MFGDMAFEMTRTFGGKPFKLGAHLERLYASLALLEIDCGLSMAEMEGVTLETLARNKATELPDVDWQIMHDVSRGPLGLYRTVFADELQPTVVINCWPLITHMGGFAPRYDTGVSLCIPSQQALPSHLLDAKAKTRSRVHYMMANLQAGRIGSDAWAVLLDTDGYLAEGTGSNVFLVRDGELLTPEPRNILLGVSRATILELAGELGVPCRETNLGRYEAMTADEAFVTGTSFCICHACSFEGHPFDDGSAGPVVRRLRQAWVEHVGVDFVAQAKDYAARLDDWLRKEAAE
jgi:branched-chain amino acid aminotransferase